MCGRIYSLPPSSAFAGWRWGQRTPWAESWRAITRQLGAMLILRLNKKVSRGGGVGAGTAPWHRGCIRAGVASRHPGSQSRTCSPAPIYMEQEAHGCLPVQRSSPLRWKHLWQVEQSKRCTWKPLFPPTHTRKANEKMKADRGLIPRVWFWLSFMKEFHRRPWDVSSGHHLQAAPLGVSRTISGWRAGCSVKQLGITHSDWSLQYTKPGRSRKTKSPRCLLARIDPPRSRMQANPAQGLLALRACFYFIFFPLCWFCHYPIFTASAKSNELQRHQGVNPHWSLEQHTRVGLFLPCLWESLFPSSFAHSQLSQLTGCLSFSGSEGVCVNLHVMDFNYLPNLHQGVSLHLICDITSRASTGMQGLE